MEQKGTETRKYSIERTLIFMDKVEVPQFLDKMEGSLSLGI